MFRDIPRILYKYRDWDNEWNKTTLFKQELYFPSPDQLNDPFDASIPYLIKKDDLTPENIYLKSRMLLQNEYPEWTDTQIDEKIFQTHEVEKILEDPAHWNRYKDYYKKETNRKFGIVSLSKPNDHILMWSHYAKSHTGFCIGFDSQKLVQYSQHPILKVHYQDDNMFPEFGLFDFEKKGTEAMEILLTSKSKIWEYEEEYRLLKIDFSRQKLPLPTDAFKEIILGYCMSQKVKREIIEFAKDNLSHIEIFDCKINDKSFKLDLDRIF